MPAPATLTLPSSKILERPMAKAVCCKLNYPDLRLSDGERLAETSSRHLLTVLVNRRGTLIHILSAARLKGPFSGFGFPRQLASASLVKLASGIGCCCG